MKRLLDYIEGKRKGKEAHSLEREAMEDSFLQEALDGYDEVEGKHAETIFRLQQKIAAQTQKKKSRKFYWYAAASILLLVSTGIYFFLQNQRKENSQEIAYQEVTKKENSKNADETYSRQEEKLNPPVSQQKMEEKKPLEEEAPPMLKPAPPKYWAYEDHSDSGKIEQSLSDSAPSPAIAMERSYDVKDKKTISQADAESVTDDNLKADTADQKQTETSVIGYGRARKESKAKAESSSVPLEKAAETAIPVIGTEAYNKYLQSAVSLSADDKCALTKGTAVIQFMVDSSGRPKDIKVIQSLCKSIDKQLIKLIKNGSDWTQGPGQIQFTR